MLKKPNAFDVVIIGGGPIGLACAIAAHEKRLSYLIIEKGALVNSLYNYPLFMTFFSTSERLEIGGVPFMSINPKPNRNEALEYYRRVAQKFTVNINLFEKVEQVKKTEAGFDVQTTKQAYLANNVIVATGFYDIPVLMNIPGENLSKVHHYYKDPHLYAFSKVVVVGANNSAVDAALETYRKGAAVTMIIRGGEMGSSVKYWVRPDIDNRIAEGNIVAHFNTELIAIGDKTVTFKSANGVQTIPNDFVIAMTGYQPDFAMLERFGIAIDQNCQPSYSPQTMETNVPGLYLAGVVCGGLDTRKWFIENSRRHAQQIMDHILVKTGS